MPTFHDDSTVTSYYTENDWTVVEYFCTNRAFKSLLEHLYELHPVHKEQSYHSVFATNTELGSIEFKFAFKSQGE